jgi:hypothetical protein
MPLAAAQTPHRIPHQEKLLQVARPPPAASKTLPPTVLALDRNLIAGMHCRKQAAGHILRLAAEIA